MTNFKEEMEIPESLLKSVKSDCNEGEDCFNSNGCNKKRYRHEEGHCYVNTKCFHNYCDKFKWIIDRAKHYSEKTGIPMKDILNGWEKQRGYSWNNFYQEANQPEIKSDKVIVVDNREDFFKKFPSKKFICPNCKGISTDPNTCNSGAMVNLINGNKKKEKCNWCSGGLFGTCGEGIHIYLKDDLRIIEIFKPIELDKGTHFGGKK